MENAIILRPHHGLCIQFYSGKGYDEKFIQNMNQIIATLNNNPCQIIELCTATDVICECCPNNINGICGCEKHVIQFDVNCLELCGFYNGQLISWETYKEAVKSAIIDKSGIKNVCENCRWLRLCIEVLK